MHRLAKRAIRSASVAALLALSLVVPTPTRAADRVTPSGTIDSSPVSADGSLRTFTGDVAPFGPVRGTLQLRVDRLTGHYTGQFTFHARGGVAYGTIAGQFTSENTYVEVLAFTGWTGEYAVLSGSAVLSGTQNSDGTAVDTVIGGQIWLP